MARYRSQAARRHGGSRPLTGAAIRLCGLVLSWAPWRLEAADVLSPTRLIETLGALAAVIAAIFVLAFLARRLRDLTPRAQGALKIIDNLSLGARERVVLVQVDSERVLLAVAGGRIETLHRISQPPAPTFSQVLQSTPHSAKNTGEAAA
jgi:flagellar protein FliO/FliZ